MLGAGLQFARGCGDDRFYNPTKARRAHQGRQNDELRRAQSDFSAGQSPAVKPSTVSAVIRESENGSGCEEQELPKSIPVSAFEPVVSSLSNLERFLQSITPSVPAQYLSKVCTFHRSEFGFSFLLASILVLV